MADAVTTQVLYESKSDYVVKFTNKSDGTGESAVAKIDPAALSPTCTSLQVVKLWYSTAGMGVEIYWDADTDTLMWILPQDRQDQLDFEKLMAGRLVSNAGTGATGKINFTTVGHSSGDTYSVIMHVRKVA